MPPTQEIYVRIKTAAARITAYAASIQQAHELGHGPGPLDELWTREYQEKAMQVYTKTIPWSYLINLGNQFNAIARDMTITPTPASVGHEWLIVSDYLRATADAILSFAPLTTDISNRPLESSAPSVMEFGLLAEIASADGAEQLHNAGHRVGQAIETQVAADSNPLTPDQIQLLHMLGDHTLLEIGESLGYSKRSVQRKLADIQTRLGARSRHEAVTIATTNNWLIGSPNTDD